MDKILLIQTAFLGDVVLATPLIEKLKKHYPQASIDFLLRKGNETLLEGHPLLHRVLVWEKKKHKYLNLLRLLLTIRRSRYDLVVNLQRYFSTGILTVFSGAAVTTGFDKNPLSVFFTFTQPHRLADANTTIHEVERNLSLIKRWTDNTWVTPKLYPSAADYAAVEKPRKYICLAPGSVWFTKMLPADKWLQLLNRVGEDTTIFLLGSKDDYPVCEYIRQKTLHVAVQNLAGKLSLLEAAALMKFALMNYVNDSAPLHLASAMDAPVAAFYCSTVPDFGFGPLSRNSAIMETRQKLPCRPCGLHGKAACPQGHFACSDIDMDLAPLPVV